MKQVLVTALAVAGWVGLSAEAQAFGLRSRCCDDVCCAPACPPPVKWVEKTITSCKPQWTEKEVTCTVNRLVTREVVTPMKRIVMVPEWKEEKRTVTVCRPVLREVEREVVCCRLVPASVVDSCTGCTYTVCKPETFVRKVKCMVPDWVREQKEITVKICCPKAVEQTVECRRLVCEVVPETVKRKIRTCEMVPCQVTVKVPVCCP